MQRDYAALKRSGYGLAAISYDGREVLAAPLPVYEGTIRLTRELIVQPAIRAGDPSVYVLFRKSCLDAQDKIGTAGVLEMQSCDERQCYPPRSIPLAWKFKIYRTGPAAFPCRTQKRIRA